MGGSKPQTSKFLAHAPSVLLLLGGAGGLVCLWLLYVIDLAYPWPTSDYRCMISQQMMDRGDIRNPQPAPSMSSPVGKQGGKDTVERYGGISYFLIRSRGPSTNTAVRNGSLNHSTPAFSSSMNVPYIMHIMYVSHATCGEYGH